MNEKRRTPEDEIEKVVDRATFVRFLQSLAEDWAAEREIEEQSPSPPYSRGALGWENGTIGAFLGAAVAWADDVSSGITERDASQNLWRQAAEIILAGKHYE